MAGLGCGLGSIVLGVITLLAWGGCCMYDMVKPVSSDIRSGISTRFQTHRSMNF